MINFNNAILKAISDYKLILRKTMSTSQCTSKMQELGIKRQHVKKADEVMLYQLGLKIKDELRKQIDPKKNGKTNNFYHGAGEFLQHLENLIANYRVENGRVVHVGRQVSCVLVEAVQLITFAKEKLVAKEADKVIAYSKIVATHGSVEQKSMFLNAVKNHQEHLIDSLPQEMFV